MPFYMGSPINFDHMTGSAQTLNWNLKHQSAISYKASQDNTDNPSKRPSKAHIRNLDNNS
jgi:hypothetical protein